MEHEFSPRPLSPRSQTQLFAASSMSFAISSHMAARGPLDLNHRGAAGYQEGGTRKRSKSWSGTVAKNQAADIH